MEGSFKNSMCATVRITGWPIGHGSCIETWAHNTVPMQNPMSILNMALLSILLTPRSSCLGISSPGLREPFIAGGCQLSHRTYQALQGRATEDLFRDVLGMFEAPLLQHQAYTKPLKGELDAASQILSVRMVRGCWYDSGFSGQVVHVVRGA